MDFNHLLNHPHATFHDSILERLEIDYVGKKACLQFQISTGDPESKDPVVRESMRSGQLNITGLLFLTIEPPDESYPYQKAEGLWVDEGEVGEGIPKNMLKLPKNLPPGAFVHWFFVNDWNSLYLSRQLRWSLTDYEIWILI
ncbi:MAG: hypothetical protein EHM45_03215 [Desulfobacteraceae bacterium]|nr:MAG: hypothetical protein EHM45_03215 [Desulfobacteraceae bacterium]